MKRVVLLGAVLLAGACAHRLLTRFDHRAHLADRPCGGAGQPECLACVSCHPAPTRRRLTSSLS